MNNSIIEEARKKDYKISIFKIITAVFCLVLIGRLFYLQVFNYKNFSRRAQYSTSKISVLIAPRGTIYDRNENILATNKQAISVIAYPDKFKTRDEKLKVYNILSRIIKSNNLKLKERILKLPENAPLPVRIANNISVQEASQIVEKQYLLPGINIQEDPIRYYPNKAFAAHTLGYISEIDEDELETRPERRIGDLVGKYGVEKLFDGILRGTDGKTIAEIDRYGKPIDPDYKHSVIHYNSVPGKDIQLTIDLNIQKSVENALRESKTTSCAIVVNPKTGEVLALASYPDFDPNVFRTPLSTTTWNSLLSKKALLNRALLSYVPGSIWKPVTLLSALESKAIKPTERFRVSEAVYLGKTRFGDWTDKTGIYSLQESLAWSRDTAFYQIGQRLKPEQIKEWGVKLGAGRNTGIELLGEDKGIVPDEKWKKQIYKEPWYPGNTLHFAIGQSFLLITPTQVARIYSAIANGSSIPVLHIIKKIHNKLVIPQPNEKFETDPLYLKVIREGLEMCVEKGTGQVSKIEGIKIAGKTGSAEVLGSNKTHSWFAAYAPADNPEIVVVVLAEKGGHGGTIAAPIAKKIFEGYFNVNKNKEELAKV